MKKANLSHIYSICIPSWLQSDIWFTRYRLQKRVAHKHTDGITRFIMFLTIEKCHKRNLSCLPEVVPDFLCPPWIGRDIKSVNKRTSLVYLRFSLAFLVLQKEWFCWWCPLLGAAFLSARGTIKHLFRTGVGGTRVLLVRGWEAKHKGRRPRLPEDRWLQKAIHGCWR